jgi:hypothetical protein
MWSGFAASTLIKQYYPVDFRVKEPAVCRHTTGTRAAMQENYRYTFRVAAFFNINGMYFTTLQVPAVIRVYIREELSHVVAY